MLQDTIVTEAHCHLPLPKKFVRQCFADVIDSGAPRQVDMVIFDDDVQQPGVLTGSIRPQSRKMAISPGAAMATQIIHS